MELTSRSLFSTKGLLDEASEEILALETRFKDPSGIEWREQTIILLPVPGRTTRHGQA
jgi:hypothetical protein